MGIANIINNSTTTSGGEIVRELVNSSDGAGLNLQSGGNIAIANGAAQFGTSDFSLEFILNQEKENTSESYIYVTHTSGDNRLLIFHDVSDDNLVLDFRNASSASTKKDLAYDMNQDFGSPTHYVITFDRDGLATLYKNGNSVATVDISSTSAIDIGTDSSGSRIGTSGTDGVIGTFYRFRTWNKLVDAKALYERADVDFADQYGSQTEKIGDAANRTFASGVGNWGAVGITAANDSGALKIPQTAAFGGGTNNLASFAQRAYLGKDYFNTGGATENNKRYRLSFDAKAVTGGSKLYFNFQNNDDTTNTALNESVTLTTSFASYSVVLEGDFGSAPKFLLAGLDAAESFWLDNVSIVAVGAVVDLDLAFANENQSMMVADRSTNNVDGEMSSSGVKQTQVIKQLNSTAMRVGGTSATAATPADGAIISDNVGIGVAPDVKLAIKDNVDNTNESGIRLLRSENSDCGWINMRGGSFNINTRNNLANAGLPVKVKMHGSEVFTIDPSGKTTSKAADNVFTVQDTEDTVADANAEVRIGESDASGNLNNYWGLKFAGTASGGDLDVNRNGTTALTISSSGLCTFSNGIAFSQTDTSATGATATGTTLDHYEEGTWTPTAGGDSTYTAQTGRYTRVGRLVTATFDLTINARTGSTYIVSGLPFSAASGENIGAGGSIIYYSGLAVSPVNFSPTVAGSTVHIRSATSAATSPSNHGLIAAGSRIAGIVTYTV